MKLPDPPMIEEVRQWLAHANEDLPVVRHRFCLQESTHELTDFRESFGRRNAPESARYLSGDLQTPPAHNVTRV